LINGEPGNPYGLSQLKSCDVIVMDAPGSGGYGNTLNRGMPDGYMSLESARNDYGIVINPQTMKADRDATEKLRNSLKK
jgi:N-methylhydantoinase B